MMLDRLQKKLEALGCEAQVDLENKCAVVPDTVSEAAVKEAVEKAGYTFVGVVKE